MGQVIGRFIGNLTCSSKQWPVARKKFIVSEPVQKDEPKKEVVKADPVEESDEESDGDVSNNDGNDDNDRKSKEPIEWPDSLRRYLVSVMERCSNNPKMKAKVQMRLKKIIESSIEDGSLYTRDWENDPPELIHPKLNWVEDNIFQDNEHNDESDDESSDNNSDNSDDESSNDSNDSSDSSDNSDNDNFISLKPRTTSPTISLEPPLKKVCKDDEQHFGNDDALQKRLLRFSSLENGANTQKKANKNIIDVSKRKNIKKKIIGTCTVLEKPYTRSSVIIDLSTIRPEHILHKSFDLAVRKHNSGETDYYETNSQLLSIRQDMVVQGIKNELTVSVYEFHGRLAILNKDLSGFNQCQGKLSTLYASLPESASRNMPEFLAYRVLYCILLDAQEDSLEKALAEIYRRGLSKHSLDVAVAVALQKYVLYGNYPKLFSIYDEFSGRKIRDTIETLVNEIIVKYRDVALRKIMSTHIGSVTKETIMRIFNFKTTSDYQNFIEYYNPVYDKSNNIDPRATFKNMLRVPPPKVQMLYTINQHLE